MQSTKQQLLVLLKRAGSATVEEAAAALSVASMTARQHLVGLERDGLVCSEKVKRSTGRPHFVFRLTAKGEDLFPRRFDLFAQLMLDEIGRLAPDEIATLSPTGKRSLLIQRVADRIVEEHRSAVEGRPLAERVAAVAELLHEVGGFAEWCDNDGGFEIRDYNCIFSRLAPNGAGDCEWHLRLLTNLLQHPVRYEVFSDGRSECCRYLVGPGP